MDRWDPKRSCFLRIASSRNHFDLIVGLEVGKHGFSDLAGCSEDEDLGFVWHGSFSLQVYQLNLLS
jgi:hypothetical protein